MTSFFGKRFPVTASGFHAPAKLFIAANCWRLPHKVAYDFRTAARDSSQEDTVQAGTKPGRPGRRAREANPRKPGSQAGNNQADNSQAANRQTAGSSQAGSSTRRFSSDSRQQPADKISAPRQETAARKTQPR